MSKATAELKKMKNKLSKFEREAKEAKKAKDGVKKWKVSARQELKLTDLALKKADEKETQL
jgi:hypothetical protein